MKGMHLLGLVIIVSSLLLGIFYFKEGFIATDTDLANQNAMVQTRLEQYNRVGEILSLTGNVGILGPNSDSLFNSVINTRNDNNESEQQLFTRYPLQDRDTGLSLLARKCEAVKTMDCNVFDRGDFTKDCGVCLDIGKDSTNKPHSGGLVLTEADKKEARDRVKGTPFLPAYQPVLGSCPSGKLVSTKKECLRLQKQLLCEKGTSFGNPNGCSQCFQSGEFSIVDPNDSETANLIVGSGTLLLWGSGGIFTFQNMSNGSQQTDYLSNTPRELRLSGGEGAQFTVTIKAVNVPVDYDDTVIYRVDDLIIFNDKVYRMNEGTGVPGYNPSTPYQERRWDDLGSYQKYQGLKVKPIPQVSGILIGQTNVEGAIFQIDFNRLIIADKVTGRKARVTGTTKEFQYESTTFGTVDISSVYKLSPGFGQETMSLHCTQPFSFVDIQSQESTKCPSSPFVTKEASATFMQSDPCYARGSVPGSYSVECLQGLFLSNGCTSQGKGFPINQNNNLNATRLNLPSLADYIYDKAIIAATGVNTAGIKQEINDWSNASEFCTGKKISSPCDISMGLVSDDCIVYLWDNTGDKTAAGSSYSSSRFQMASGDTKDNMIRRFCTREGSLSPKDMSGKSISENMTYWKKYKTADAVKRAMALVHQNANDPNTTNAEKTPYVRQCYGIVLK
jgi:hypothetical protein